MSTGIADGDCTHHLAVVEGVDLAGVAGYARADQGIVGEGHRLHLAIMAHVE